jgi:hypothetical protein
MFRRTLLGAIVISACVFSSDALAGSVELTTFYPIPTAKYKNINSTGQSCFATTAGQNASIGIAPPTNIADPDGTEHSDLTITGSISQEDWITVPKGGAASDRFQNNWENRDSAEGYNPASYFRDKNGIVHLRGVVQNGTIVTGFTDSVIFQLPVGYRPAARELHINIMKKLGSSHSTRGRCDIDNAGNVIARVLADGEHDWFSLDGISFRANGY